MVSPCLDLPTELTAEPRKHACKRLATKFPNCCCEAESVSPELSPGKVENSETLARFVSPIHIDDENEIRPTLFSHASESGMSVTRIELAGIAALQEQQSKGSYVGFVSAKCIDLRAEDEAGRQLHCIYDTAGKENVFHADVCQSVFGDPPKGMAYQVGRRMRLMRHFTSELQDANSLSSLHQNSDGS